MGDRQRDNFITTAEVQRDDGGLYIRVKVQDWLRDEIVEELESLPSWQEVAEAELLVCMDIDKDAALRVIYGSR